MRLKVIEQTPPIFCSQEAINKLEDEGINTSGWIEHLRWIIRKNGFELPYEHDGSYGFILTSKLTGIHYTRICLSRVDAMAEEILLLHDEGMLKYYKI